MWKSSAKSVMAKEKLETCKNEWYQFKFHEKIVHTLTFLLSKNFHQTNQVYKKGKKLRSIVSLTLQQKRKKQRPMLIKNKSWLPCCFSKLYAWIPQNWGNKKEWQEIMKRKQDRQNRRKTCYSFANIIRQSSKKTEHCFFVTEKCKIYN